jgi:hypothetical protein
MAKRIVWTELAKADVWAIEQRTALQVLKTRHQPGSSRIPTQRCSVSAPRIIGDVIEITRVSNRKEAYR